MYEKATHIFSSILKVDFSNGLIRIESVDKEEEIIGLLRSSTAPASENKSTLYNFKLHGVE